MGCKKIIKFGLSVLLVTFSEVVASVDVPSRSREDRAEYWSVRGRPDLAEQSATGQIAKARNSTDSAGFVLVGDSAALSDIVMPPQSAGDQREGALIAGVKLAQTDRRQQANYWRQHGRSDLSEALTEQSYLAAYSRESPVVSPRDANVVARLHVTDEDVRGEAMPMPRTLPQNYATSSLLDQKRPLGTVDSFLAEESRAFRRDSAGSAEYWQRRGRPDLAAQLRPQLQSDLQPHPLVTRQTGQFVGDGSTSTVVQSLSNYPVNAGIRLKLTSELSNLPAQRGVVRFSPPDLSGALFAIAQVYVDQQMWRFALQTLERISPVSRSPEIERLQRTVWAQVQIERADILVRQGRNADAQVLLKRVASELVINSNSANLADPPPLWGSGGLNRQRRIP